MIVVITLALGIGANTAIFSVIDGIVLRPIPGIKDPERLVAVYTSEYNGGPYGSSSYLDYLDFRDQAKAFSSLAAYGERTLILTGVDQAERLRGMYVTGNYFATLGVIAHLGRLLSEIDDAASAAPSAAVISNGLWRRRFGGDPAIIGRKITIDGRAFTIVGVASETFRGSRLVTPPEAWLPLMSLGNLGRRSSRYIRIVGRLKNEALLEQAQSQITAIMAQLARAYPQTNLGTLERPHEPRPTAVVREGRIPPQSRKTIRMVFGLLLAVVTLVLLIACADVANLLLARASARRDEVAVRLAIGASRGRLLRQLLTESLMLALLGGSGGLLAALWSSRLIPALFSPGEAGELDLSLDWRIFVFTLAASLLTGVLCGLAPAFASTRLDLVAALKDEAAWISAGRQRRITLRQTLVVAQVALTLLLLIGAGLFLRSLNRALSYDLGFESNNLLIANLGTSGAVMNKEQEETFYRQALERIGSMPGVRAVSLTDIVPMGGGGLRRSA